MLFAVVPEDMRTDPAKFRDIIGIPDFWNVEDVDWDNHDQKVSDIMTC